LTARKSLEDIESGVQGEQIRSSSCISL